MSDTGKIAESLRKIAEKLRKEASDIERDKTEKCAHVLIAAHGLNSLKAMLSDSGGQR